MSPPIVVANVPPDLPVAGVQTEVVHAARGRRLDCGTLYRLAVPHQRGGDGTWRSLVAHLTGGQGVVGSNPAAPTCLK